MHGTNRGMNFILSLRVAHEFFFRLVLAAQERPRLTEPNRNRNVYKSSLFGQSPRALMLIER